MSQVVIFTDISKLQWSRTAGPYRVATALRDAGYTVQVIDHFLWTMLFKPYLVLDALEKFVGPDTLAVGFSVTFFNPRELLAGLHQWAPAQATKVDPTGVIPLKQDMLMEVKEKIRQLAPKAKIVLGGATKHKVDDDFFDAIVTGFADLSFPAYVQHLEGSNPFFQTGRIGTCTHVPERGLVNVNETQIVWTDADLIVERERLPIEVGRGCIFKCKFCAFALNGKKKFDYLKDVSILDQEMRRNYELWGITDYHFTDDTYNDSPEKVKAIRDMSVALPFEMTFRSYLRQDLIYAHPHTAELLYETGLRTSFFGIESLNHDNTKLIGKGMPRDRVAQNLERIRKVWQDEVLMQSGFIFGLPFDSADNMQWAFELKDLPLDTVNIYPLFISRDTSPWLSKSDFDTDYESYGYEFEDPDPKSFAWKNTKTGYTFQDAMNLVAEVTNQMGPNRNRLNQVLDYHVTMFPATLRSLTRQFMWSERHRLMHSHYSRLMAL